MNHASKVESGSAPAGQQHRNRLTTHLRKTKICIHHLKGSCPYGDNCLFAHSCPELQSAPDLRKTRLCQAFELGLCNDPDCRFAHGRDELRSTDIFYKKALCIWNQKGKCRNGGQCSFAHSTAELRTHRRGPAAPPELRKIPIQADPWRIKESAASSDDSNPDDTAKTCPQPKKVLLAEYLPAPQLGLGSSTPPASPEWGFGPDPILPGLPTPLASPEVGFGPDPFSPSHFNASWWQLEPPEDEQVLDLNANLKQFQ